MIEYIKLGLIIFLSCFTGTYSGCAVFDYLNKPKIYEIKTCEDLKTINNDLDGVYILMNDIDGKDCK